MTFLNYVMNVLWKMSLTKCPRILVLGMKCPLDFVLEKMSPRVNVLVKNVLQIWSLVQKCPSP